MSATKEEEVEAERCLCCSLVCAALNICCFMVSGHQLAMVRVRKRFTPNFFFFQCSRKACSCCFPKPPASKPEFSVLCLGVNGAGKTSLLCQLAGEPQEEDPDPTMGFSIKPCTVPSATLQIKEVGGAGKLRPYWSMYYSNLDALVSTADGSLPPRECVHFMYSFQIFVVDSSTDRNGLLEATFWLNSCLSNPDTAGLPLLVLCNKQDLSEARAAQTVRTGQGMSEPHIM